MVHRAQFAILGCCFLASNLIVFKPCRFLLLAIQFSNVAGASACTPCAPGSIVNFTGARSCSPCPAGCVFCLYVFLKCGFVLFLRPEKRHSVCRRVAVALAYHPLTLLLLVSFWGSCDQPMAGLLSTLRARFSASCVRSAHSRRAPASRRAHSVPRGSFRHAVR